MKKHFLIDTSVLMRSPTAFFVFEDNDISISTVTLEELDGLKEASGERGYAAREAIRTLYSLNELGDFRSGIQLPGGGMLKVLPAPGRSGFLEYSSGVEKADNIIIRTAKESSAILVTADISMYVKAKSIGVNAEIFNNQEISDDSVKYTGRTNLYFSSAQIDEFYKNGSIRACDCGLTENEFVVLVDEASEKHTALGRYTNGEIVKLRYDESRPSGISPKNVGQRFALEALMLPASEVPLVILKGPAGTAKTFLSLAAGLHNVMDEANYRNVLLLRPNIKFDEDIGYLPGTEEEKISSLIRPCRDNLVALLTSKKDDAEKVESTIEYVFKKGWVTAEALAFLRGRSIANTYILVDEAQNSSPLQMLGIITRAGIDSKYVIVGDPAQIDNPKLDRKNNGLVYASEKMKGSKTCAQLTFSEDECVRSVLSKEASIRLKM